MTNNINLLENHPDGLGKFITVHPDANTLTRSKVETSIFLGDIPFIIYTQGTTPTSPTSYAVILDSDIVGVMRDTSIEAMMKRIEELSFYTDQMYAYLGIQKELTTLRCVSVR